MAQQTQVILIDDIDGGSADETVDFGLDGKSFVIDLSEANAAKLRDALAPYVGVARRVSGPAAPRRRGRAGATASSGVNATAVREWAKANGIEVNARGRIPKDVLEKYVASSGFIGPP